MAFQGIFRRSNKMVVVKPIRLGAKVTLEVGTIIDMKKHNVRPHQLRIWFRRHKLGTVGSPWAEQMLKGIKRPESEAISKAKEAEDATKLAEQEAAAKEVERLAKEAEDATKLAEQEAAEAAEAQKVADKEAAEAEKAAAKAKKAQEKVKKSSKKAATKQPKPWE